MYYQSSGGKKELVIGYLCPLSFKCVDNLINDIMINTWLIYADIRIMDYVFSWHLFLFLISRESVDMQVF